MRTFKVAVIGDVAEDFLRDLQSKYTTLQFQTAGALLEDIEAQADLELILLSASLEARVVQAWADKFRGRSYFYFLPKDGAQNREKLLTDINSLLTKSRGLEDEIVLSLASEIQNKLLPANPPDCEGYDFDCAIQQHSAVGGDFYWHAESDESLLLAVGDVSGKSLSAAILVGVVAELLDTIDHLSIKTLKRLNRQLCLKTPDEVSVACTIVEIDLLTGRFRYCNAGNPPVLILGHDRRVRDNHQPSLGWLVDYPYEVFKGYLAPYETLVLFSDGVKQQDILSRRLPAEELSGWTDSFLNSTEPEERDDRVLLTLRRLEPEETKLDWKTALHTVAETLDRIRPSKLFSFTRQQQMATPIGSFGQIFESSFDLIFARYTREEFLEALIETSVLPPGKPGNQYTVQVNTDQTSSLSRSVTVMKGKRVALSFRGFLGHWAFESPLDGEREQMSAYLLDQVFLGAASARAFRSFLVSSLNSSFETIVVTAGTFKSALRYSEMGFRFLNPSVAGQFVALKRELAGEKISERLENGDVILIPDKMIVRWRVKEMILSNNEWWTNYFAHPRYDKLLSSASNLHHYRIVRGDE
ncbi:MAG: serine/threonine-protein phosphatase [Candidatus Eremiobacteraeota bacterium]|nr:serine/threonine-protein phosphatase [Candidatus Eremiobacteraeota bacterium]